MSMKKEARQACKHGCATAIHRRKIITQSETETAALIAGVMFAVEVGLIFIHAAVA